MTESPEQKAAFEHGYLIAVSNLIALDGSRTRASDLVSELGGITWAKVKSMDLSDWDMRNLAPLFNKTWKPSTLATSQAKLHHTPTPLSKPSAKQQRKRHERTD